MADYMENWAFISRNVSKNVHPFQMKLEYLGIVNLIGYCDECTLAGYI